MKKSRWTLPHIKSKIFLELSHKLDQTILIAGAGRSGTTWVANVINSNSRYRIVFEPFSRKNSRIWESYHIREYIRPSNMILDLKTLVQRILKGEVRGKWIDNRVDRLVYRNGRIVKVIGANLFLKWLSIHFPQVRLVFLIRDPFAVAKSRVRCNWNHNNHLADLFAQPDLVNDYLHDKMDVIEKYLSPFERHLFVWAVEHRIIFDQFSYDELNILSYEDLVVNPKTTSEYLFTELGIEQPSDLLNAIQRPSRESDTFAVNSRYLHGLTNPRSKMSEEEIQRGLYILSRWGLDCIYSSEGQLNWNHLIEIMKQ